MMTYSTAALVTSFLVLLCLPKSALSNLENQMLKSLQAATRCKKARTPPTEPVLAFSPKRYAQLVAVLRTKTNAPTCGKLGSGSFNINEPKTWPFCAIGNCVQKKCSCISSYTGPSCSQFGGKCWLVYCFVKSCKKSFQNIHCKCDPSYYGKKVLSGDYWYDDGKKESYVAPPKGWTDALKGNEGSKISAAVQDMQFPSFAVRLPSKEAASKNSEKQKQPEKTSEHKEDSSKAPKVEQTKHKETSKQENEVELPSGNDEEETGDEESEDLEDETDDESSSYLFTPSSMPHMITIVSAIILYVY